MSIQHAQSGEVMQLSLGTTLRISKATTLVKTADLELMEGYCTISVVAKRTTVSFSILPLKGNGNS